MRKNLGPDPLLYPQPVMIIGTYDKDGNANAMNAAWGGIVGYDEIIIDLSKHKTTENILETKAFTVSMADEAHVVPSDYVGLVSGAKVPDKISRAGFTITKSSYVNAPIINELPVALECELIKVIDGGKYLGRIVNVSADESVLGTDGKISLDNFRPIIFDPVHHGYYGFGNKVGDAFKDGSRLK